MRPIRRSTPRPHSAVSRARTGTVYVAALVLCLLWPAGIVDSPRLRAAGAPQEGAWGEPVEGAQLRVSVSTSPTDPARTPVSLPTFEVQVRNLGSRALTFSPVGITLSSNIEIDGVWHSAPWAGSCCPAPQTVPPGTESTVFRVDFRSGPWALDGTNRAFTPAPGTYSIRLRSAAGRFGVAIGSTPRREIVLISNAIAIHIPDVSPAVEREALVDEVVRTGSAGEALRRLVEKYPDAALRAIQAARPNADVSSRGILVSWLSKVQNDEVTAFLRAQLGSGVDYPSRSAAAWILLQRGDPAAIPAAVAAWQELQAARFAPPPDRNTAPIFWNAGLHFAISGLITTLAGSGDAQAVDALAFDLLQAPLDVRLAAVGVFLGPDTGHIDIYLNGGPRTLPDGDAGRAIERMLLAALDDSEQRTSKTGTINGVTWSDPRVCDMAALVLATRWPEKYRFPWSRDLSERDVHIAAIRRAAGR